MKYHFKIFLLSALIGFINILIFFFLLQFQLIRNSSYVPKEAFTFILILIAIPIQFLILVGVAYIFKRDPLATLITSGLFIVVCTLLLWVTSKEDRAKFSNEQVYNRTEKYDYQQGISTPEGYPIKLLSNSGFHSAVKGDRIPYTLLETNKVYSIEWGVGDTTFKSSDAGGVGVPDNLKLHWYSFLEDKYYSLNTELDQDKISEYFKNGFLRDIKGTLTNADAINVTYRDLVAGISPGGDVILWLSGVNNTKEIAVFKADEMSAAQFKDYDTVTQEERQKVLNDTCTCEDRPQFRKIVHNDLPIPFGIWTNKYRQKFNWKLTINDFGQTKSALNFYFFNGERHALFNEDVINITYQNQVLPDFIKFTFIKNEKKYQAFMEFDEEELFTYFEELTQTNPHEPIAIIIKLTPDLNQAEIQLQSQDKTLSFEKMKKVSVSTY